jgi:hypothetical protein
LSDAVDSGTIAESWRQQPGAPGCCTEIAIEEMQNALDPAEKSRLPRRSVLVVAAIHERVGDATTNPDAGFGVRLNCAI